MHSCTGLYVYERLCVCAVMFASMRESLCAMAMAIREKFLWLALAITPAIASSIGELERSQSGMVANSRAAIGGCLHTLLCPATRLSCQKRLCVCVTRPNLRPLTLVKLDLLSVYVI